jgi:hypothetical protein
MDHIDEFLATACQNIKYSEAIRAALALGKQTLNRYYDKTDQSEVYRIAMGKSLLISLLFNYFNSFPAVLHPRHKLHYFKKAGWDEAWIETARDIVRAEFDQTYAFMDVDFEESVAPLVRTFYSSCRYRKLTFLQHSSPSTENIFDDLPALSAPPKSELRDELDRYLSTDPEHVTDPFEWWYERRSVYPRLHRMALDYQTIPGKFFFC